jgi:hypothetical protein
VVVILDHHHGVLVGRHADKTATTDVWPSVIVREV